MTLHHLSTLVLVRWLVYAVVFGGAVLFVLIAVNRVRSRRNLNHLLTATRLSVMDKEVQRACRFIEETYADDGLTPSLVAAGQSTGAPFLEALFARELGMSITEFIDQVRVNRAKISIAQGAPADPETLGPLHGIADPATFERAFQRIAGVSLADYGRATKP